MHSEMETLRSENAVLKGEIERRDDAIAEMRQKLEDAELRERRFNDTLADSIAGATLQQRNDYNYLQNHVDTVVSAATLELQQQNQTVLKQLGECNYDLSRIAKKNEDEAAIAQERLQLLALAKAELVKMQERLEACGEPSRSDESCSIM
jgi:2-methylisocitrate lyase-like PEP mutase family enzyme